MRAISLFSGAGGMDVGFRAAGFDVVWANELNRTACQTYRLNHANPMVGGDLDQTLPALKSFLKGHSSIACVFGGPPCQGFSVAGKMNPQDPRSQSVHSFMQVVALANPLVFVMENVKNLAVSSKFASVRQQLLNEAQRLGYHAQFFVLNAKNYGVPQHRERLFFIGTLGFSNLFNQLIASHAAPAPSLRQVLLACGKVGSSTNNRPCSATIVKAAYPILRPSPYAGMLFNGQGRPLNLNGVSSTLPASMGGNRTPIVDNLALYQHSVPWVEQYHAHLKAGGNPTTGFSVPASLRRLTIDEAMAIQTFPASYQFCGAPSAVFKQIGNAVPCRLAQAVATTIMEMLRS